MKCMKKKIIKLFIFSHLLYLTKTACICDDGIVELLEYRVCSGVQGFCFTLTIDGETDSDVEL